MHEGIRYKVLAPVGSGGFGTVYRAEFRGEGGFSKVVAIKMLKEGFADDPDQSRRLRDEARVLGLVRHRAIVQVDRLVRLEGRWAVVMEYVEGIDLKGLLRCGPVPPRPALELVAEVASALHAAFHTAGPSGRPLRLLHRDIKPSNLLVTPHGEVKILDFGVARADFQGREARTGYMVYGSLEYMAPERMELVEGPEGDVYALGATLYELLAARRLGKAPMDPRKHRSLVDERLGALRGRVAPPVVELLRACLDHEPLHRPDARSVARACAEFARSAGGPTLQAWAEAVVPPLLEARQDLPGDAFSGRTLVPAAEEGPAPAAEGGAPPGQGAAPGAGANAPPPPVGPPPPPPPHRLPPPSAARRRRWVPLALVGGGLVVLLLLLVVRGLGRRSPTPLPVPPPAPETPGSAASAAAMDAPPPPAGVVTPEGVRADRRNADTGADRRWLRVASDPEGAAVWINGFAWEEPTPTEVPLAPGTHRVRLEREGFLPATRTVEIAEEDLALRVPLEPRPRVGEVVLRGPAGAVVGLGDEPLGAVPVRLEMEEGRYTFKLVVGGEVHMVEREVRFPEGVDLVEVELE